MRPKLEPVGALVRELREALGLTQKAFATKAGLEREHLSMIETDRNKASTLATRTALAAGAGLELRELNQYLAGELDLARTLRRCVSSAA